MPLGYHLPPDYYRAVPTSITACTVLLVWITLPVLSYNPDLMDPILSDYYEAWADWAKSNVLKMFNFMLWVSFYHCNFYENVARIIIQPGRLILHETEVIHVLISFQMHLIQCIIAIQKCRVLGINSETTMRWIFSVAINGFFALRYLIWPDRSLAIAKTH